MGTSTDGILVFGLAFEEDELPEFLDGFDGDFDGYLDSISGLPGWGEPEHDYTRNLAFRAACPADLTWHCSHDYPMYILAVRGTEVTASRGYPKVIETLDVPSDKIAAFKAWCAERGVVGDPKWYLCSMWG